MNTQTSDLSSITAKIDKLTGCVTKISQIVGKCHQRDTNPEYSSDEETLFPDNSDADDQSLQSASSSKSSKRRKSVNRNHDALSAHPFAGCGIDIIFFVISPEACAAVDLLPRSPMGDGDNDGSAS